MTSLRSRALAAAALAAALIGNGCSCQNPATSLVFSVQPAGGAAGEAISPAVAVTAKDKDGNTAGAYTGEVTVTIASGPPGAALGGTTTVAARAGVATLEGLSLNKSGAYTLTATAPNLPPVTSGSFTIAPGADESLSFLVEPWDTSINRAFTPAVQVAILDRFGNRTRSTAGVRVQLSVNPGSGTLRGTTTVNAVDGIAAFGDLSLDAFGTGYKLAATSGTLVPATSQAFSITAPRLAYVNPTTPSKVRLVRDDAASTDTSIVLKLEAAAALSGYSVGLNLPLDAAKIVPATMVFTPGAAFPPGQAPDVPAYGARIASSGPLAGVLVTGQSQKPTGAGAIAGDTAVAPGAVFYRIKLDMTSPPNFGLVFDGTNPDPKLRASVRDRQGTEVVSQAEFAIGRLEVR